MSRSRSGQTWAVTVRLANGAELFYAPGTGRGGQADWSPRATQAQAFDSPEAARRLAEGFSTNGDAREYAVEPLTR